MKHSRPNSTLATITLSKALLTRRCSLLALLLLAHSVALASNPTHRYSFETNANDSIGTAHGALLGAAVVTNSALVLNGANGLVQLPNDMFTNSKSLTLEIWFTNKKVTPKYAPAQQLWSFQGSPSINYVLQDSGFGTPVPGCYYGDVGGATNVPSVRWRTVDELNHLVWTQNENSKTARIYVNDQIVGERTNFTAIPGPTTNCFLGGATANSPIDGLILEFRVYSNALSHLEVLQSGALGPDSVPVDQDPLVGLQLRLPSHVGLGSSTKPILHADFASQERVNIAPLQGITYSSSDTNVISANPEGWLVAGALGSAEIVAEYVGLSSTTAVTVVDAGQFGLAHRYDFEGVGGVTNVPDVAGGADGNVVGGNSTFTNAGQLFMRGAHVDLPDGILSSLSEVTIEAWVTGIRMEGAFWPRIFDFGDSWNHTYFFLCPDVVYDYITADTECIRFGVTTNWDNGYGELPRLTGFPWMLDYFETHFAVSYSPARNTSKLYRNGILVDSGPAIIQLSQIVDTNNWLGRSQWANDERFHGLFNEFRIYRTILEDSEIAASYARGPDEIGADYVLQPRISGTDLTLSWGPSASWCQLESRSTTAPAAPWTVVTNAPALTNGRFEVVVPITDESRYFRLASP